MRLAIILATTALAGCVGQPCEWDDPRWGGSCFITEGQGDGPDVAPAAPDPAPEPAAEKPEPVAAPDRPEPSVSRPEPASVPDPEPEKPVEPEPEPEKPDYADYANPGDDALFEGFSPEEVAMKQMDLAARRAEAEAAHDAEFGGDKPGGANR